MDEKSKIQSLDMKALQTDLVNIASQMKRTAVLESAGHVEKTTFTGIVLASDIQNIRAAINGLEAESSGNCCESNCCQTCQGCQSKTCQVNTCQACQGCQGCQTCQKCQSPSQCRENKWRNCGTYECYSQSDCNCSGSKGNGSDDGGP